MVLCQVLNLLYNEVMSNSHAKYFHALNLIGKFTPLHFHKFLQKFSSMEKVWNTEEKELRELGLTQEIIDFFFAKRKTIEVEEEWQKLQKQNIQVITIKDKDYPPNLKEIFAAPVMLYLRGKILPKDSQSLAIVGARKATAYGRQAVFDFVPSLCRAGLTIVSGLAVGIDSSAHQAALQTSGRTIAVLGSGIDDQSIYPPTNRHLAKEIIKSGALISEYPPGTLPLPHNFPQRNRIISGLSLGSLIIEAKEKSGALITARFALEQNREVFALPGSIYHPESLGPNTLIKMGAKLVQTPNDILEELHLVIEEKEIKKQQILPQSKEEEILLKFLSKEPLHIDKLVNLSKLDTNVVQATLTLMELSGKVQNVGGMRYVIK